MHTFLTLYFFLAALELQQIHKQFSIRLKIETYDWNRELFVSVCGVLIFVY